MKKHLLTTTAAGIGLAIAAPASAGGYLSVFGGYSMSDQEASARVFQASGTFGGTTTTTGSLVTKPGHTHTSGSPFWTGVPTHTGVVGSHNWSNFTRTMTVTAGSWKSATDLDFEADSGFVVGAAFGKDIATGLRGEIEFAYRKNDVKAAGTHYFETDFDGTGFPVWYTGFYWHAVAATVSATVSGSAVTTSDYFGTSSVFISVAGSSFATMGGSYFTSSEVSASGDISAMSIMANVWLDVDMNLGSVHPYVGAGVGYADVTLEIAGFDVGDTAVAFQVAAGFGWDLPNSGHRINFEVRRFVVPKLELTHGSWDIPLDYETTEFIIGYRINF